MASNVKHPATGLDRQIAPLALLLMGAQLPIALGVSTMTAVVVALLPVTLPVVLSSRPGRVATLLTLLAVGNGLWLSMVSDRPINTSNAVFMAILLVSGYGLYATVLWSSRVIGTGRSAVWFCIGLLVPLVAGIITFEENAWKYGYSLPVAALVCVLFSRQRAIVQVLGVLIVGLLGAFLESRSFFAICLATVAIYLYSSRKKGTTGRSRANRLRPILVLSFTFVGIYIAGTRLFSGGYLGDGAQAVTAGQLADGRSLLVTARPEWFATFSLMEEYPWGMGIGTIPTLKDYLTAAKGLADVGIDAGGPYYTDYLFGGHFKLHSVLADLWVNFGVFGLVTGLTITGVILFGLLRETAGGRPSTLAIFASLSALWFVFFGPIMSNFAWVMFALAVAHARISAEHSQDGGERLGPYDARDPSLVSARSRLDGV